MTTYRHTQQSRLVWVATAIGGLVVTVAATGASGPVERGVLLASLGLLGVTGYLFSSLTVEVDAHEVRLHFGPGFWKKRFALAEVEGAAAVRNSPIYGWGIRLTPRGWLYNVSGLDAVELRMRGGRRVRIGTDDPERLHRAITEAQG